MFYLGNIHCMTRTGTDVMKLGIIDILRGATDYTVSHGHLKS